MTMVAESSDRTCTARTCGQCGLPGRIAFAVIFVGVIGGAAVIFVAIAVIPNRRLRKYIVFTNRLGRYESCGCGLTS